MLELVEDMLSWTLVFRTGEPSPLGGRLRAVPSEAHIAGEDERDACCAAPWSWPRSRATAT